MCFFKGGRKASLQPWGTSTLVVGAGKWNRTRKTCIERLHRMDLCAPKYINLVIVKNFKQFEITNDKFVFSWILWWFFRAFSVVETIEAMNAINTGILSELSIQEVIDCSYGFSVLSGCNGGDTCAAFSWMKLVLITWAELTRFNIWLFYMYTYVRYDFLYIWLFFIYSQL